MPNPQYLRDMAQGILNKKKKNRGNMGLRNPKKKKGKRKEENKTNAYNNRVSLNGDSCIIPATKVPSSATPELPMNKKRKNQKKRNLFQTFHHAPGAN